MVRIIKRKLATYVYSKGCGLFGALGLNNRFSDTASFQFIHQLPPEVTGKPLQISAGWGHSAYTTDLGQLIIFGRPYDFHNLLRQNNLRRISTTITRYFILYSHIFDKDIGLFQLPTKINEIQNATSVRCSAGLTIVLNTLGQVYTFGSNKFGQCAVPKDPKITHYDPHVFDPSLVSFPFAAAHVNNKVSQKVIAIDSGLQHCIVLTSKGHVYTWGKAKRGQLGCGVLTDQDHSAIPILVEGLSNIIAIAAGFNHSVAIDKKGSLFVWGRGMSETLKTKDSTASVVTYEDQWTPRKVTLPGNRRAVEVCCSNFATIIRAHDNSLWAMGMGEYDRNTLCQPVPVLPALLEEEQQQQTQLTRCHKKTGAVSSFWSSSSTLSLTSTPLPSSKSWDNNSNNNNNNSNDNINSYGNQFEIVQVTANTRIRKGYNRVNLLVDIDDDDDDDDDNNNNNGISHRIKTDVYDVVVHNFEAYLKPVQIDIANEYLTSSLPTDKVSNNQNNNNSNNSNSENRKPLYRITDYSQGWLHALLALETIPSKIV